MWTREADLTLTVGADAARLVAAALAPEVAEEAARGDGDAGVPRTHVDVRADGDDLHVAIRARDTPALRAAVNAYLRWVRTALDVTRGRSHGR